MSTRRKAAGGETSAVAAGGDVSAVPAGDPSPVLVPAPRPKPSRTGRRAVVVTPPDDELVRAARGSARQQPTGEAAAVRDDQGRTWTGTEVAVTSLRLSPVRAAVVAAIAGGAVRLESAVVVSDAAALADVDLSVLRELGGPGIPVRLLSRELSPPGGDARISLSGRRSEAEAAAGSLSRTSTAS